MLRFGGCVLRLVSLQKRLLESGTVVRTLASAPPGVDKYVQGQSPEPRVREYFYYVDHQGMLFLDDARMKNFTSCFKEEKFLEFFFRNLRRNKSGRYESSFPFVSMCGRERNFVRCDDLPVVFTHLQEEDEARLLYAHAGRRLSVPFRPAELCVPRASGRLYHPAPEKAGGVGLVRSKLAEQLEPLFRFPAPQEPPSHFLWKGTLVPLSHHLLSVLDTLPHRTHT